MTMATTTMSTAATGTGDRPGRSLEELVDGIFEALCRQEPDTAATEATEPRSIARSIHEARRLRQTGDLDGALALFAGADLGQAREREARWAFGEWVDLARRRFGDREGAVVYSPVTGRAAVLAPHPGGALEVLSILGMRWEPGKVVSRRSLRGLRPLAKGGS
ncbi:MAG: hypothetical protein OXS47_12170 [Chloroflexota bacterium]|nr:hypothetical protein [Chloroflexota bacterium]